MKRFCQQCAQTGDEYCKYCESDNKKYSGCQQCKVLKDRIEEIEGAVKSLPTWQIWQTMSIGNVKKSMLELLHLVKTGERIRL